MGDVYYNSVELLLHMDGANNGTTFTDSSKNTLTLTRAGTTLPVTVTGVKKFGTASLSSVAVASPSTSTGGHLNVTLPTAIGTGQFTIEAWVRQAALDSNGITGIFDNRSNSTFTTSTSAAGTCRGYIRGTGILRFAYGSTPTTIDSTATVSANVWYHVAFTRDASNVLRIFLDGNLENSATVTEDFTNVYLNVGPPNIITVQPQTYLDDFRITLGVCRYTESFTPPIAAFPDEGESYSAVLSSTLANCTAAFEATYTPYYNAQLSSTLANCTAAFEVTNTPNITAALSSTLANCTATFEATHIPPVTAQLSSTLANCTAAFEVTNTPNITAALSSTLAGITSSINANFLPSISISIDNAENISLTPTSFLIYIDAIIPASSITLTEQNPLLGFLSYHTISYASNLARLHQVSYYLGEIQQKYHSITWATEAQHLHSVSYESVSTTLTSDQRFHTISYRVVGTDSPTSASRYHTILYEGSGVSPLVSDQHLHTISYTVIGTDPLTSASRYHEILYEVSGTGPLVSDQHLHTISYTVVGADPISSASAFNQVFYSVITNQFSLHEIFYKSIILDKRLHTAGWQTDTEQSRLHTISYHTTNINSIIEAGLITVGDGGLNTYDFLGISITADEESPYWQCEVVLKDSIDYIRFPRDTAYIVRMFNVDFHFIVDSRSLQRSIDDQGSYQETCTITGLSPLALKARPRAARLTKTWETPILASAVITELLGTNTWDLVDWTIPAYRLACERADPLSVAKQVVEAVGGLIESQPDGSIICRHRWPTSIAVLDSVVVDQSLDERVIYAASEAPTQDELVDRVRIYDTEPGFQDRLEYLPNKIGENDDPRNGILYAFLSPWRENLQIVTTRPSVISIGASTTGTRIIADSNEDYPAEIITFADRTSSTQYPILNLTSLDWLDEDLGAAVYTPYATTLEASNGSYGGYSLAKVEYTTRYLAVPVSCASPLTENVEAQFLLLEDS